MIAPCKFQLCLLVSAFCLLTSACNSKWLGTQEDPPLPGERISVLELQKDLQPDPLLSEKTITIPSSWDNKFWPQAGGYPNHSMGHLGLGPSLERKWSVSIGEGGGRRLPLTAQPIVVDGILYTLDTRGNVTAWKTETGDKLWRVKTIPKGEDDGQDTFGGGLAFADGRLFVTAGYNQVRALDPENGETLWQHKLTAPTRAAPAALEGRVLILTLDNQLFALSSKTGEVLWSYAGVTESTGLLGSASPAANRNIAVVAFSSGELFALRTENGQVIWTDNLAAVRRVGALSAIADIRGLPVIDKGMIFAISYSGRMVAIDQRTGARIWQREISGAETPWVVGDTLFVITSDSQLVALDRRSGDIHWISKLPEFENEEDKSDRIVWTGPVLGGGRLILASTSGDVLEMDPQTGQLVTKWEIKGKITVPPIVADNTLYLLTETGKLLAYR